MKDDKLDIKLRDKLGQMPIEPPSGMWERIEKGLAAASSAEAVQEVITAQVRPLRLRVLSWSAVVAACLLAGVISFSILNRPESITPLVGEVPEKTHQVQQSLNSEDHTGAVPSEDAPHSIQNQPKEHSESPAISRPGKVSTDTEPALIAREDTQAKGNSSPSTKTQQGDESRNEKDEVPILKKNERPNVTDRTLLGNTLQSPHYKERKKTTVSTSLFATNFGGINLGGDVMGNTRVDNETPGQSNSAVKMRHKMPLTFGLNVSYGITDMLSVETGLVYTYLYSKSETTKNSGGKFEQKLHYLGIPVMVRHDIWNHRYIKVYGGVGGTIEKCISAREINKYSYKASEKLSLDADGFQFSVNAAAGVQFRIDKNFGLYLEPGLNYFFDAPKQPESYRTQNPLTFSVKAGFRIMLR